MIENGHSKFLTLLGAVTLLVLLAGHVLPYSDVYFDIEVTEVLDFDTSENDQDSDDEKEKFKTEGLQMRGEFASVLEAKFPANISIPTSPLREILSPPPERI